MRCCSNRCGICGNFACPASPLDVWRTLATDPALVTGGVIPAAGHFLAEENHAATLAALQGFLA